MRTLEHRRHTRRDLPGGVHLNAAGREIARRVAPTLPRFDRVVTSPLPRAVETAEALGLPVDSVVPELAAGPDDLNVAYAELVLGGFAAASALLHRSSTASEFARDQAELWSRELGRVPDGGSLLMISHGGLVETGAIAALPRSAPGWGAAVGYLEGVRLRHDGSRWIDGEPVRVAP